MNNEILKTTKDYAEKIRNGSWTLERLSPKEEQGRIQRNCRNAEATLYLRTSLGADATHQTTTDARQRQEATLTEYAKAENIWYENAEERFGTYIGNGAEQYVYYTGNGRVTKINNIQFHDTALGFLDRLALHNYIFPEAPYNVIGFTTNKFGDFSVIVEQPFVIAERGATRSEMKAYMDKLGYNYLGGNDYMNDDYYISDLHPGNALITPQGNIAVIDPIIYLNTEEEGYGGERVLNSVY
ncbi:MAG: hypothetical protein KGV44_06820 [Flavobacteriaceae bacterium]|nr:hypothetical protein [Flavobacteriaceae bacterium]